MKKTNELSRDWQKLEELVLKTKKLTLLEREKAMSHAANVLGRTFAEIQAIYDDFASAEKPDRFLHIIYWLGKLAVDEVAENKKRIITFSPVLRERLGHHIYGEIWANNIKEVLLKNKLIERPIHIISANMHSVMNSIFAYPLLTSKYKNKTSFDVFEDLSSSKNKALREKVKKEALKYGMIDLPDTSGTNIDVQIFDTEKIDFKGSLFEKASNKPVLIVMDYAFGEQAYETIDELLKPYKTTSGKLFLNVESVSIMGKAGILQGGKGDLMIPNAHVNEGTADNYSLPMNLQQKCLRVMV